MISVSDQAKAALWESLQKSGVTADRGLRLQPGDKGFILELDTPNEEDRVIRHQQAPVLIINGDLDNELDDLLIDVSDGPQGPQLTIRPLPEAEQL